MENYFTDRVYENIGFSNLQKGEYESCIFKNCDLSSGDLRDFSFIDCEFDNCNLSNCNVQNAAFRNVSFNSCKMLGIDFTVSNKFIFSISGEECNMDFCVFYEMDLKKTAFSGCSLRSVDFGGCDLSKVAFNDCDLKEAIFDNTKLIKTDFSTAFNYIIDPENNNISKALFGRQGLHGLLNKYDIFIK